MLWLSHAEMRCGGKSCVEMRHALACTRSWCLCDFELRLKEEISASDPRKTLGYWRKDAMLSARCWNHY